MPWPLRASIDETRVGRKNPTVSTTGLLTLVL
jgi:hypothetical protein